MPEKSFMQLIYDKVPIFLDSLNHTLLIGKAVFFQDIIYQFSINVTHNNSNPG